MGHWKILELEVNTSFGSANTQSWKTTKEYQVKDLKSGKIVMLDEFQICIEDLDADGMKGTIEWRSGMMHIDVGPFELKETMPAFYSPTLNVSYETTMTLTVRLIGTEKPGEKMKLVVEGLVEKGGEVLPPATDAEIEKCNAELAKYKLPLLPPDYVDFMKICCALEFNGMSIFGTYGCNIVAQNEMLRQFYSYHRSSDKLLVIGRIDDDVYTYNATTHKYEARDLNDFEIWDTYNSFYDFFFNEMMKWMR